METKPEIVENIYFEMESKGETQEVTEADAMYKTPVAKPPSSEMLKQDKDTNKPPPKEPEAAAVRRMLFIAVPVIAVSLLTALATLVLAVAIITSRNDPAAPAPKDPAEKCIYATKTELKEIKENMSYVQYLIANISQMQGPQGPSGRNGTQGPRGYNGNHGPPGPPGYNGTQGPPGPPDSGSGSTNLTLCSYRVGVSAGTYSDTYARQIVQRTKPNGKKFLGVNCDSDDAKFVTLSSTISGGKRTFKCKCDGTHASEDVRMYCNIHFWECPA